MSPRRISAKLLHHGAGRPAPARGGGNRVVRLYDVSQAKFGLEHNLIDFADK